MKLAVKLAVAMVVVALLPLGGAAWLLVDAHVKDLQEDARKYNVATADLAVNRVSDVVEQGAADALKAAQAFAQPIDKELRTQAAYSQLLGSREVHALALFLPPAADDGKPAARVWAAHAEGRHAPLPPESLEATVLAEVMAEGRAFLPIETAQGAGHARFLPVVFPVYVSHPKRRLYAYAWAPIDLTRLNAEVAEISSRHHEDVPGQVFIIDDQRKLLAFHDAAQLGASKANYGVISDLTREALGRSHSFTGEYADSNGKEVLAVVVTVPEHRWAVVVEQRAEVVYSSVSEAIGLAVWVAIAGLLLALLLGVFLARRLAAPVVAVAEAAAKVAAGDFDVRVAVSSKDEVGQMAGAFNAMAGDLDEYSQRIVEEARIRGDLSRYLSNEIVEQVMADPDAMALGGERREVTVMFADVVAFTRLTEEHDPVFLVGILNELFTIATEIVFKHGGIIDKFMGDSLMAVFGAPHAHDDDPLRAITAGEELLRWLEAGNTKWRKELGVGLQMGVGVASGPALAGNIGSERRMDYTVIGDTVNIAARLESLAKPGQLLMTAATAAVVCEDFEVESIGVVELPGRDHPLEVFRLDE